MPDTPIHDIQDLWNDSEVVYNAFKISVDDQDSDAESALIGLYLDNSLKFSVLKDGEIVSPTISSIASSISTLDGSVVKTSGNQTIAGNKTFSGNTEFAGTVTGVTKTSVGLSNVNNTSDLDKPISSATQTALNSKVNSSQIGTGANQLVQLDGSSKLPAVDGSRLTNISSGTTVTSVNGLAGGVLTSAMSAPSVGSSAAASKVTITGNEVKAEGTDANVQVKLVAKGAAGISLHGGNASGPYSTASGNNSTASGQSTTASGYNSTASGYGSVASGKDSTASADYSTASGTYSIASGSNSTASGYNSTASGDYSIASGAYSTASGDSSTASGQSSTASGHGSVASGKDSTAIADYSTASGYSSTASGNFSIASGYNSTASGDYSIASGKDSTANANYSTASGLYSTASGLYSTASGAYSTASGFSSTASGLNSTARRSYEVANAAGRFTTNGDAQTIRCISRDQTTNATAKVLSLGTGKLSLETDQTLAFKIMVTGQKQGAPSKTYFATIVGIVRNNAGTVALVGVPAIEIHPGSEPSYAATVEADNTAKTLDIKVTGGAGETVQWIAETQGLELIV